MTYRMQAIMEELSKTSQQHHELILDSLAEGVFTVDLEWRITSFNRAAEIITGIKRSQAIGRQCFEVFRADVCETGCMLRRTIETKAPISNMPVHVYRADQKKIPIRVSTTLLEDARLHVGVADGAEQDRVEFAEIVQHRIGERLTGSQVPLAAELRNWPDGRSVCPPLTTISRDSRSTRTLRRLPKRGRRIPLPSC